MPQRFINNNIRDKFTEQHPKLFILKLALIQIPHGVIFCPVIFGHAGKRHDKKAKVNFKIYGVINWETNNENAYLAQYDKKQRKPDNKIWSVNRI